MNQKVLKKELMKYAIPGILGLLANSLYIVIDGIFVSKMLGAKSLAAVTLVVPVVEVLIAISLMISIGSGVFISINLARKEYDKARSYFNNALLVTIVLSLAILLFSVIFNGQIVNLLGATSDTFNEANSYFIWFIVFVPFFMLNYALGTWVRNDGSPRLAMSGQILGALTNIILDYVFMGPLQMGIAGAAIATGLGPVVGILIYLPHFLRKKGQLYFTKIKLSLSKIKELMSAGIPSFSIEFALGAMSFICNIFIVRTYGSDGLAAFGVIGYVNLILLSVFLGIGQGTQPIISRFVGNDDTKSIQYSYLFLRRLSFILGALFYLLIFIAPHFIASLFLDSNASEVLALTSLGLQLFFFSFPITGVNILTASIFEAKHSVLPSVLISLLRSVGVLLPVLLVLQSTGINYLLWTGVAISEILVLPISLILWKKDSKIPVTNKQLKTT